MHLSHAHSHRAPQPKSYLGIGLVVALHLAGIYALSAGLITPPAAKKEIITLKPLPPEVLREPPPPPVQVEPPRLPTPTVIQIMPPDVPNITPQDPPLISTATLPKDAGPVITTPTGPIAMVVPPQAVPKPLVQSPGAVCSVMPKPEVPAVNWAGEAVLQVVATVRGGRVVGTDFRVVQGALDGKTKRSLQRSAESALAGYQCQGDATFQQDFAFRLD